MKLLDLFWHLRHRLLCSPKDAVIETASGVVFMRCMNCSLRSPGMETGPLKVAKRLPGDPSRHRAVRPVVPHDDADVAVGVFEMVEEMTPRLSNRVH